MSLAVRTLGAGAAVAAVGVGLWFVFTADTRRAPARPPPVPVRVTPVVTAAIVERIEAIGTVQANESIIVTAKVTEVVTEIRFREGEKVRKGQILVLLSNQEEKAQLAKAEADLLAAEQQYQRVMRLRGSGTATDAQVEQVTARRAALRAEILAINARLNHRIIRAPFAGVMGIRQISTGALIQPGTAIAPLDDLSRVKIDFSMPETFLGAVRPGQEVQVQVAAFPKKSFSGKIDVVGTRIDVATRAATVRALLPNPGLELRPGMLATVQVIRARRTALVVPEGAIVPIADRNYVFVAEKGIARRLLVRLGAREPSRVEVVSGVQAGQSVVVEGTSRIRHGSRVVLQGSPPRPSAKPSGLRR